MYFLRLSAALWIVSLTLSGCIWAPGQNMYKASSRIDHSQTIGDEQIELIPITPKLIAMDQAARQAPQLPAALTEYQPGPYRIGPGDILYITVWEHPELTVPAGPQQQLNAAGRLVQSDGSLFYPYIGKIQAEGATPQELRDTLTSELATYLESPQVDVSVLNYASQRIWVSGAVTNSAPIPVTVTSLTLNDAVSQAGLHPTEADLSGLRLSRDGVTYTLDIDDLAGAPVYLKGNDRVYVPFLDEKEVFVVGEVNQPGALNFRTGTITLSQALGRARGLSQTTANGNAVYVIRGTPDLQQAPSAIYQLEAKSPSAFAVASHFQLLPGDVVFVGVSGITRWNRFVVQLLPFSGLITNAARTSSDIND
ncbi:polysaccharide biosynthesis/export family protein [Luteimonas salinilitoris]|uniref:Polysaccharide biosynthesis/export family protein n=1 Tax=Luteimonas salinilitoris TaxID=3237697 RepID=A0ABV4HN57_9GAMM